MFNLFDPCPDKPTQADIDGRIVTQQTEITNVINSLYAGLIGVISQQTKEIATVAKRIQTQLNRSIRANAKLLANTEHALQATCESRVAEQAAVINRVLAQAEERAKKQPGETIESTEEAEQYLPPIKPEQLPVAVESNEEKRWRVLVDAAFNLGFALPVYSEAIASGACVNVSGLNVNLLTSPSTTGLVGSGGRQAPHLPSEVQLPQTQTPAKERAPLGESALRQDQLTTWRDEYEKARFVPREMQQFPIQGEADLISERASEYSAELLEPDPVTEDEY